jgi:hypothetical protein
MDPQTAAHTLAAACGLHLTGEQILADPNWLRPAFRAAADRMRFDPPPTTTGWTCSKPSPSSTTTTGRSTPDDPPRPRTRPRVWTRTPGSMRRSGASPGWSPSSPTPAATSSPAPSKRPGYWPAGVRPDRARYLSWHATTDWTTQQDRAEQLRRLERERLRKQATRGARP